MKETDIAGILTSTHTIALVGVPTNLGSSQLSRDEHSSLDQGYHVIPVSLKSRWQKRG